MLKFDIKYFLSKELGYYMIFLSIYFYLKKIKLFYWYVFFLVVVYEILLV